MSWERNIYIWEGWVCFRLVRKMVFLVKNLRLVYIGNLKILSWFLYKLKNFKCDF